MRNLIIPAIFALTVCFAACGGGNTTKQKVLQHIKMPEIPTMITTPEERAEYVATHFWDTFDFADTAYVRQPDYTEQGFADYVNLLNNMDRKIAVRSIANTMNKAKADTAMYHYFMELTEKYLYDPNSPMKNEELYIPVLENIVAWDKLEDIEKIRPQSQLDIAMRNREGTKASDFSFKLKSGKMMNMYDVKANWVLLFINNPGCPACAQVIGEIENSDFLNTLLKRGELKIVAIYPDEDLAEWNNHYSKIPATWINGYDYTHKMRNENTYDLKAIPTLYLLDKDKTVVLKDAVNARQIENYLAYQYPDSYGMTGNVAGNLE